MLQCSAVLKTVLLAAFAVLASQVQASTLSQITDGSGSIVGYDNVSLTPSDGPAELYNVRFVSGTCADAYGMCSEASFSFLNSIAASSLTAFFDARDASADLAAALPGSVKGSGSDVSQIAGCSGANCILLTAANIGNGTTGPVIGYGSYRAGTNTALNNGAVGCGFDSRGGLGTSSSVWVVWTPVSTSALRGTALSDGTITCPNSGGGGSTTVVPLPAGLPLVVSSLGLLALMRRRRDA